MTLLELAFHFGILSLISVGGMPSVMPELQRLVVHGKGWLTPDEFIQAFAVGQAAPGPNILIASLIGWKVAVGPARGRRPSGGIAEDSRRIAQVQRRSGADDRPSSNASTNFFSNSELVTS